MICGNMPSLASLSTIRSSLTVARNTWIASVSCSSSSLRMHLRRRLTGISRFSLNCQPAQIGDHLAKSDSQIPDPPKPHSDYTDCTCATPEEHALMVAGVDDSFVQDKERAKLRQERNTSFLRMEVVRKLNGHSRD